MTELRSFIFKKVYEPCDGPDAAIELLFAVKATGSKITQAIRDTAAKEKAMKEAEAPDPFGEGPNAEEVKQATQDRLRKEHLDAQAFSSGQLKRDL